MEVSGNNVCATSSLASVVPSTPSAASSTVPCGHSGQRSLLLDLHADAFNYLCSFIPIDDLLLRVAGVSSDVRRRVWANHELWQQLWMRYLRDFYDSLIPSRRQRGGVGAVEAAPRTPSPAVAPPPGSKDVASSAQRRRTSADTPTCSSAAWRLYYYHRSQEARPRVELLDRLSVTPHDISDPQTAEAPHASASAAAGAAVLQDRIHDETLRFSQACATQLVAGSVTHLEAEQGTAAERSSTHHYTKRKRGGKSSASAAAAAAPLTAERKAVSLARRRARQAARLRRVLRFLLSADDHRPILHDRLWTSTYEAGEAYERSRERRSNTNTHSSTAAASSAHLRRKGGQRGGGGAASAAAGNGGGGAAVKDTLRPLSWLDDRERSVKVILFDDNSRTVGDLGSVQAERIKLLSAIAHHWRLAYAHQFYLTGTDGADRGSGQPSPPPLHPAVALRSRVRALAADASAGLGEGQPAENPQQQQQREDEGQQVSGRLLGWEQTYRRFRDDSANTASARIRDSLRRVVTAGSGGGGDASESSRRALGQPPHDPSSWLSDSARRSVIPSSGNPLFDLHLLTHTRRKNFYAAMLASTVEVPEGMGAFFATSVSEPFLRWWCWRSRCLLELTNPAAVARGGTSGGGSSSNKNINNNNNSVGGNRNSADALHSKASSHTALVPPALADGAAGAAVPHTIWVARVCSVHKPQYGTTASDGSFGRPAPIEAEESIAYSSSYSDVTSTSSGTLASASSIEFEEDVMLEEMRRSSNADEERAALARDVAAAATGGSEMESGAALLGNVANPLQPPEAEAAGGNSSSSRAPQLPHHTPSPPPRAPRVALLFPLPHMLAYWFMVHHVTFYSYQVYRRMWGDQEINIAVCSRILSPTGHTVECRLFYTLRCSSFPRMYTKMMFTPGTLPTLTMPEKLDTRSPYRSHSTSSDDNEEEEEDSAYSSSSSPSRTGGPTATVARRRDSDSDSAEEREGNGDTAAPPPAPLPQQRTPSPDVSATTSSDPRRARYADLEHRPVDGREVYDLFWTGFGRVEVESGPTISRSNLVRLRVSLGLPVDYPMGLLWNVLMFASGVGPLILKDHRHSLYFNYPKSFTDVVEEEFGEASCYGYGARPTTAASERPMPNPLDAEVRRAQEQHELDEAARILVEGAATAAAGGGEGDASHASGVLGGGAASFSTAEGENDNDDDDGDGVESSTSSLTTSASTFGSWGLDSEFSSMGEHSSWRDWRTPYSDAL